MERGIKTEEQVKLHLEKAQKYQKEHGCSLAEAMAKTDFNNSDRDIVVEDLIKKQRKHIAAAEEYQKEHKCGIAEALSATSEPRNAN